MRDPAGEAAAAGGRPLPRALAQIYLSPFVLVSRAALCVCAPDEAVSPAGDGASDHFVQLVKGSQPPAFVRAAPAPAPCLSSLKFNHFDSKITKSKRPRTATSTSTSEHQDRHQKQQQQQRRHKLMANVNTREHTQKQRGLLLALLERVCSVARFISRHKLSPPSPNQATASSSLSGGGRSGEAASLPVRVRGLARWWWKWRLRWLYRGLERPRPW